ncbi:MAG: ABC-F family ATP-binding cassette domain-containing protein [Oscillospiraceae bacterium]|jgi:ATPase subunit of ABC transporter with duplicated ATPase domains|nr:ABC-F family ATP-binding cassette domain-containing protein [Oscillospiraceae bacterium]
MIELSVNGAVKAFVEGENILDGVSFELNTGEHVALLGKNGAGKTTLFRAIVGEIELDEGAIAIATGRKLGLISQIPTFPDGYTADDVLREAHRPLFALRDDMERLANALESSQSPELLRDYDRAASEFERLGGYTMDAERNRVAYGLSIPPEMRAQMFDTLSGGEKTRVNLARLILEDTDILLLDEPTNHLDMRAVEWLEEYLAKFRGTALIISHDRYFLDRAVTRSVELERGKAELYSGNYTFYVAEKQRRQDELLTRYEREQKEIKRLEAARDRLYSWATEASIKKSQAMDTRIERTRKTERPQSERGMRARFSEREFRGDDALIIKNLSKSFENKPVFADIEVELRGGERIALIGDNGAGKTTLLRLITGADKPDTGFLRRGPSIKMAFLPQHVEFENPYATLLDTVIEETKCPPQIARNRLGAFKFPGMDVFKLVCDLSGGEKSRLRLCILMDEDVNFLILDEPTNHLDIASREWIEGAVADFQGTLLFVSHDRYFCEQFADRIWELENGALTEYKCGFTEYKSRKSLRQSDKTPPRTAESTPKSRPAPSKNRQKQLAQTERGIAQLESKLADITRQRDEYATDYAQLMVLDDEEKTLNAELETMMEQWEQLSGDE